MKIVLAIVILAAAGGGYFGWQQHQDLQRTKADLATTKASLDQATAEARNAKADAAAARKEVADQKAALQQARSDVESAKSFLEMEKIHSARLQQELTLTREQIAYLRTRSSGPGRYPEGMLPMPVRPRIEAIRIAPNSAQQRSFGAASPAKPPVSSEGYTRPQQ
jgi:multidrug efflux pump subunit AcrA (membrane-fusion protein)